MSRKGRRGRSRKAPPRSARTAAVALDVGPVTLPSAGISTEAPAEPAERLPEVALPGRVEDAAPPPEAAGPHAHAASSAVVESIASSAVVPSIAPSVPEESPAAAEVAPDDGPESADLSVPPVGDLDVRFFAESTSEAWLAHELELRHPQFLRKMTANVALRRARLARYVVGVVGVALALCFAALIKSAVPAGDGDSRARPAARMAMPPGEAVSLPPAAEPAAPPAAADGVDGGG